jgi:hypothetical protein
MGRRLGRRAGISLQRTLATGRALVARCCRRWWGVASWLSEQRSPHSRADLRIYRRVINDQPGSRVVDPRRRHHTAVFDAAGRRWGSRKGRQQCVYRQALAPAAPPHLVASASRPGHTEPAMGLLIARTRRVTPTRITQIDQSRAARQPQEGTMLISLQRSRTRTTVMIAESVDCGFKSATCVNTFDDHGAGPPPASPSASLSVSGVLRLVTNRGGLAGWGGGVELAHVTWSPELSAGAVRAG